MSSAKYRGYDIDLYRSEEDRWIAGVCGGIAENMRWSSAGVRVGMFAFFIFSGPLAVMVYLAGVILIASESGARAPRQQRSGLHSHRRRNKSGGKFRHRSESPNPEAPQGYTTDDWDREFEEAERDAQQQSYPHQNLKDRMFQGGDSATIRVNQLRSRLKNLDQRVRQMEEYVTSAKYRFDQELHKR